MQSTIQKLSATREPNKSIDPDEAVVHGAALIDSVNAPIFGFNVHGMVTECITGASGRPDLNPKSTIHDPEFFNCKEHRPINTEEQWNILLQYRMHSNM